MKIVLIEFGLVFYHIMDVKSEVHEKYLFVRRYFTMLFHHFFHVLELLKVFTSVFNAISYFEHLHLDHLPWIFYREIKKNCFGWLLIVFNSIKRIGRDGLICYLFEMI